MCTCFSFYKILTVILHYARPEIIKQTGLKTAPVYSNIILNIKETKTTSPLFIQVNLLASMFEHFQRIWVLVNSNDLFNFESLGSAQVLLYCWLYKKCYASKLQIFDLISSNAINLTVIYPCRDCLQSLTGR